MCISTSTDIECGKDEWLSCTQRNIQPCAILSAMAMNIPVPDTSGTYEKVLPHITC